MIIVINRKFLIKEKLSMMLINFIVFSLTPFMHSYIIILYYHYIGYNKCSLKKKTKIIKLKNQTCPVINKTIARNLIFKLKYLCTVFIFRIRNF